MQILQNENPGADGAQRFQKIAKLAQHALAGCAEHFLLERGAFRCIDETGYVQQPGWCMGTNCRQAVLRPSGARQRLTSASMSGRKTSSVPNRLGAASVKQIDSPVASAARSPLAMKAVLPIPGSPVTNAICLCPVSMCCVIRSSISRGASRPTMRRDRASVDMKGIGAPRRRRSIRTNRFLQLQDPFAAYGARGAASAAAGCMIGPAKR